VAAMSLLGAAAAAAAGDATAINADPHTVKHARAHGRCDRRWRCVLWRVVQEVAVETYGALDKKEKTDFILEQVRLTLLRKDYVRSLIQSRKINRKVGGAQC
jgi:hypothetical protein